MWLNSRIKDKYKMNKISEIKIETTMNRVILISSPKKERNNPNISRTLTPYKLSSRIYYQENI